MMVIFWVACQSMEVDEVGAEEVHSAEIQPVYQELNSLLDENPDPNIVEVSLWASHYLHQFQSENLSEIEGYAYNDQFPGPLIEAEVGNQLIVHFENRLDTPTTVHWHGLKALEEMDGVPWIRGAIEPSEGYTYIHNVEQSGVFWYHPHFDTEHQVDYGLYGMLLVRDASWPVVDSEVALLIDDWPVPSDLEHSMHHDFYQEGIWLVNGVESPKLEVSGSTLLHIVNTSNHHYVDLSMDYAQWIGNDQGLLQSPQERMLLAPGDRGMLLVEAPAGTVELLRHPFSPHGGVALGEVESILTLENEMTAPSVAVDFSEVLPSEDPGYTDLTYVFQGDPYTDTWLINGESFPEVTIESLPFGEEAIMEIRNISAVHHPFHLHGLTFEVLSIDGVPPLYRRIEDTIDMGIYQNIRLKVLADNAGDWMMHCHILPHGDQGMMTVLRVE